MVHAELSHNPYLLETTVSFNGCAPKINSQVEKYETQPLKDWAYLVPEIFYNEMNGYDFDFDYSGTKSDFAEVKKAFENAGVTRDQVRLFYKNELEDSTEKRARIHSLIDWIRNNPNERFGFSDFWEDNKEFFEGTISLMVVRGGISESFDPFVSLEIVDSIQELANIVLGSTPILFCITNEYWSQFRRDLSEILARPGVSQGQLFFAIDRSMNPDRVKRVICDLGVADPQVVDRYDHELIRGYLSNYPATEYVREAIRVFGEKAAELKSELEDDSLKSEVTNAEIHAVIGKLEDEIKALRQSEDFFDHLGNFDTPDDFEKKVEILRNKISLWRNRRSKISGVETAKEAAFDFEVHCRKMVSEFSSLIESQYLRTKEAIWNELNAAYVGAGIDEGFAPDDVVAASYQCPAFPSVQEKLLSMRTEYDVDPRSNPINLLWTPKIDGPVRVVDFNLDEWRGVVDHIVEKIAFEHINACTAHLSIFRSKLSDAYKIQLANLISIKSAEKNEIAASLSDDEKKLQEDNDWFDLFYEQLDAIKRD